MSRSSAAPPAPSLARWSTPRTMFITGRIAMTSPSGGRDHDRALRDRLHRDDADLGHVDDRHHEVGAEVAGVVDGERAAAEVVEPELVRPGAVRDVGIATLRPWIESWSASRMTGTISPSSTATATPMLIRRLASRPSSVQWALKVGLRFRASADALTTNGT